MSWHFLERWLERANQHSTLIGKFWITYLIVCRMVIIGSIGKNIQRSVPEGWYLLKLVSGPLKSHCKRINRVSARRGLSTALYNSYNMADYFYSSY